MDEAFERKYMGEWPTPVPPSEEFVGWLEVAHPGVTLTAIERAWIGLVERDGPGMWASGRRSERTFARKLWCEYQRARQRLALSTTP